LAIYYIIALNLVIGFMFRIIISLHFFIFATFGNTKGQKNETINFSFLPYNDFIKKSLYGKPIMMYFTGTGCSLCIKMEKLVFPL
jgi:thioredoxin-related protein